MGRDQFRTRAARGAAPIAVFAAGLALILWGAFVAAAGPAQTAGAHAGHEHHADEVVIAVKIDGVIHYGEFHFYAVDDGSDLDAAFSEAKDRVLESFPGAVVVELTEGGVSGQYALQQWAWPNATASWRYNPAGKPANLSGDHPVFQSAASTWNQSPSSFTFTGGSVTGADTGACNGGGLDGLNTIGWAPQPGSILAVTCSWYIRDGSPWRAIEFDIEFDPGYTWTTGSSANVDLESVALHEFGHALGLAHSSVNQAVMYATYTFGTIKRQLHQDDINGQVALYSGSAQATSTPTPTNTPAPPTATPTNTPAPPTATPTNTLAPPTATPTNTPTPPTATLTNTPAPPTATPTNTPPTPTSTPSVAPQATPTPTSTPPPAPTPTPTGTGTLPPSRMDIPQGASLVTWPYAPASAQQVVSRTGGAIEAIYAYDGAARSWRLYGPALYSGANTLTTLQTGHAYWILAGASTALRPPQ